MSGITAEIEVMESVNKIWKERERCLEIVRVRPRGKEIYPHWKWASKNERRFIKYAIEKICEAIEKEILGAGK